MTSFNPDTPIGKRRISVYPGPISKTDGVKYRSMDAFVRAIREGTWAGDLTELRELGAHFADRAAKGLPPKHERYDEAGRPQEKTKEAKRAEVLKGKLRYSVLTGEFVDGHRHGPKPQNGKHATDFPKCAEGGGAPPISLSGIGALDLDGYLSAEEVAADKVRISRNPHVIAVWHSSGGRGLHVAFHHADAPTDDDESKLAYHAAAALLGVEATTDAQACNLARVLYASSDPDIYYNPDAVAFDWRAAAPTEPEPPEPEPQKEQAKSSGKKASFDLTGWRELLTAAAPKFASGGGGTLFNEWLAVAIHLDAIDHDLLAIWQQARKGKYHAGDKRAESKKPRSSAKAVLTILEKRGIDVGDLREKLGSKNKAKPEASTEPGTVPPPGCGNLTETYWAACLAAELGDRGVLIRPPVPAGATRKDGETAMFFAYVTDNGLLDTDDAIAKFRVKAARNYAGDCIQHLKGKEFEACAAHARRMLAPQSTNTIRLAAQAALHDYPLAFAKTTIVDFEQVDSDLSVVGAPNGVYQLTTGKKLTPEEARKKLVISKLPDPVDLTATDELVDLVMPKWSAGDTDPHLRTRQQAIAKCFTEKPNREFFAEVCAGGSGKTSTANALRVSTGPYIAVISSTHWQKPKWSSSSDHNGQFFALAAPTRIAFTEEVHGNLNLDFLKDVSGGDTAIPIRRIREDIILVQITAHCWFMANEGKGKGGVAAFNLYGDDQTAQAMRDRAKMLVRERIPDDKQVPAAKRIGDASVFGEERALRQRQAVVARLFQYCKAGVDDPLPADSPSLIAGLEAAVEREKPAWRRVFVPKALKPAPDDNGDAHSLGVWEMFLAWWDENYGNSLFDGDGNKKPARRAVTDAIEAHFSPSKIEEKQRPDQNGKRGFSKTYPEFELGTMPGSPVENTVSPGKPAGVKGSKKSRQKGDSYRATGHAEAPDFQGFSYDETADAGAWEPPPPDDGDEPTAEDIAEMRSWFCPECGIFGCDGSDCSDLVAEIRRQRRGRRNDPPPMEVQDFYC